MTRLFVFDCPVCGAETVVDAAIRAEILDDGCVLCGVPVDADNFSASETELEG